MMKGRKGSPGTSANSTISTATVSIADGWRPSCEASARSVASVAPPRASSRADAIEITTAGICVTSPSPTVRIE